MARTIQSLGEVAERSIAADCKSAVLVATEVRTLPSPPNLSAHGTRGLFGLVALPVWRQAALGRRRVPRRRVEGWRAG